MEKEIWKDVPEYEGFYQVSNLGNVRGLERVAKKWNSNRKVNALLLKMPVDKCGYRKVCLNRDGISKCNQVHRLVAMAFLNHNPKITRLVVNHIDGNKLNNNLSNLEIVTRRENATTCFIKNREKHTSQYVGVCWHDMANKWMANIKYNNKREYIGIYATEIEASNAYQKRLKEVLLNNI
jgi:ribosomal protein L22